MSEVFVKPSLDPENQKLFQLLIDKLIFLYNSQNDMDVIDLLVTACKDTDVNLYKYFREDLCNIFNYSCQIIFNHNICLVSGTGRNENESFRNATENFINYCFKQRGHSSPIFVDKEIAFVDEIIENCENIDVIDSLITFCQEYATRDKKFNYQNLKTELEKKMNNLVLSEFFRQSEKCVICSIFLNDTLLIQQSKGKDNKEALINTFNDMLEAYSIKVHDNSSNLVVEIIKNKNAIIKMLAEKFNENRSNSVNHWVTIEKCVKDLGFKMDVQFNYNHCTVHINGVEIVNERKDNDYCGYIAACKELISLMDKATKIRRQPRPIARNNMLQTKSNRDRDEKIKAVVIKAKQLVNNEKQDTSGNLVWPIVNDAFMAENMKLELHYGTINNSKTICSFDCLGLQICSAEGNNRIDSREATAVKLLLDPSYSD